MVDFNTRYYWMGFHMSFDDWYYEWDGLKCIDDGFDADHLMDAYNAGRKAGLEENQSVVTAAQAFVDRLEDQNMGLPMWPEFNTLVAELEKVGTPTFMKVSIS
jgi:hypothetical protein